MMIRYITLFLILFSLGLAKDGFTACNTVQITSYVNTPKNLSKLQSLDFPQQCKVMEVGSYAVVRCGCYDKYADAKKELQNLQQHYKHAKIARSYKYRFANKTIPLPKTKTKTVSVKQVKIQNNDIVKTKPTQKTSLGDEELRLMVQTFLYKGDLPNAYKVAQLGYAAHPNSYYWNEKMATISQWTGRSAESIKHLKKMYYLRYDPKIEEKLINYGKAYFQYESIEPYVFNRVQRNPSKENINLLITIYKKTGFPEKAIKILNKEYKRTSNPLLLTKMLELSLEIGDMELAQKYVQLIEPHQPYTKQDAALIAKYYYIEKKIAQGFAALTQAKDSSKIEDQNDSIELEYFALKSDLGWYLQKNVPSAKASKQLIDIHKARLVDYERVSIVYQDINATVAANVVREGYLKYKLPYMFFSYANDAINKKKFDELRSLFTSVDEEHSALAKEPLYWIIKSKLYNHYKKHEEEEAALKHALALAPDNIDIKISLLWHFMDTHDVENVKLILMEIENDAPISESLYFPLASAYFYLDNINRSSYYLDEIKRANKLATQDISYKFLLAYVKQIQNDEGSFQTIMRDITKTLKKKMKQHPELKKDSQTLSNYLRAAMNVIHADKFEKKLKKAKPYLKRKDYDEISYSWAMHNHADEKAHKIYNKAKQKELWILFYDAILFRDHTRTENLLDQYLELLPQGDAVGALVDDGQISLAQSTTFKLFNTNDANQNAYIRHRDLSKKRTDMVDAKLSRLLREPLQQHYLKLSNRSYMRNDWYMMEGFNIYTNDTTDTKLLINPPSPTYKAYLGAKKEFQRGYVEIQAAYNHHMENYFSTWVDGEYRVSADFTLGGKAGKNIRADESTQLYLGGKKDIVSPRVQYQVLKSTLFSLRYEKASFYSQDDVYLGQSNYFTANVYQQIRDGYPDIRVGVFYDNGQYTETSGSKGVIDTIQTQNFKVLPRSFYNIGLNIAYGLANREIYTRVWRPYIQILPYYNSDLQDFTFSFEAGYGGKIFQQDHMSIGTSYSDSVNGIGGKVFEIYLNYQFLYTLSKEL